MHFFSYLKPLNCFLLQKFGFRYGSFFVSKIFASLNISTFIFDIFTENSENIYLLLLIMSDVSFGIKPRCFFFKQIYRGKTKSKIIVIKHFFIRSLIFKFLLKEIFLFVFSRFFLLLKRLFLAMSSLSKTSNFNLFFIFTLPAFAFNYLYEDIDPLLLKGLKLNFVLSFLKSFLWSRDFSFFFFSGFFSLIFFFKTV